MIFRQIKVGTSVIPLFRVIFLYYFHDSRSSLMSKGQFKGEIIENMIFTIKSLEIV